MTKRKQRNNSEGRKRRGPGRPFVKGESGNPKGRPRSGFAMSELVRAKVDPAEWIDTTLKAARDERRPWSERQGAWLSMIDRGYTKPPTEVTGNIGLQSPEQLALAALVLTPHQRRARIAELKAELESNKQTPAATAPQPPAEDVDS